MLKLNEELKDRISYILIGIVLLSYIIPLFVNGMFGSFLIPIQLISVFGLAVFYALIAEKKDLFFFTFVSFALLQVCNYLMYVVPAVGNIYIVLSKLPYILAASAFGILTYKHSKEFKAFEMLEFLLVIFLVIIILLNFDSRLAEFSKYFVFGICFLIATLMYNNNLWMRYEDAQKHLLIFLFVQAFLRVIYDSAKFITF